MTDPVTTIKIILLFCLLFGTALCCLLPWGIKKLACGRKSNVTFSVLNCLAAGIVLGAALVLIHPDAHNSFEMHLGAAVDDHDHNHRDLLYVKENYLSEAAVDTTNSLHADNTDVDHTDHDDIDHADDVDLADHSDHDHEDHTDHDHEHTDQTDHTDHDHEDHTDQDHEHADHTDHTDHEHTDETHAPGDNHGPEEHHHDHNYPYAGLVAGLSILVLISIENIILAHSGITHQHHASVEMPKKDSKSGPFELETADNEEDEMLPTQKQNTLIIQSIVFTIALGIHSLFEGLGLGSERTIGGVSAVIIAVVAHKILEALALGISIYNCKMSIWKNTILIVIYSLATPVGMIISMSVGNTSRYLVGGIFNGIASGSFFYIALVELIPMELAKKASLLVTLLKLFAMFAGFAFMAGLATAHKH